MQTGPEQNRGNPWQRSYLWR